MTSEYYNDDPRYQLMAQIITNPLGLPEAEVLRDDLIEILGICYTFTINENWASASDLAKQIVAYLEGQWGNNSIDFQKYAEDFWAPVRTKEPALRRPADVTEVLIDLEN